VVLRPLDELGLDLPQRGIVAPIRREEVVHLAELVGVLEIQIGTGPRRVAPLDEQQALEHRSGRRPEDPARRRIPRGPLEREDARRIPRRGRTWRRSRRLTPLRLAPVIVGTYRPPKLSEPARNRKHAF